MDATFAGIFSPPAQQPSKAMVAGGLAIGAVVLLAPLIVLFVVVRLAVRE
jgi:hypothetical protein